MDHPLEKWSAALGTQMPPVKLGAAQESGPMAVVPIFGPDADDRFTPPLSSLKLGGVKTGYGNMELHNTAPAGVGIVPLHIGFIQDGAQNHAMCRSAFLGAGQKVMFKDACCVQQTQGGFLEGREQWFFILPLALRSPALDMRGHASYGKLWPAITALNVRFKLKASGHLEQIVSKQRATLNKYQSRFELLDGQTGAAFYIDGKLVGVEVTPGPNYFRELWMPLACFCYGVAAMAVEMFDGRYAPGGAAPTALPASNLAELRNRLGDLRWERQLRYRSALTGAVSAPFTRTEEERFLRLRLSTAVGPTFAGQIIEEDGRLVYASLFARDAN